MTDEEHPIFDHDAETSDTSPDALEVTPKPGSSQEKIPTKIGDYRIKSIIGSGGMGTVYLAQQEHPRRYVALKVMNKGITSRSALRRFEYESQILARLHHPGIAHIHEAGYHDDGSGSTPYFAMEYIPNAKTLMEYANYTKLGTRERLSLFAKICDAVHHGHQRGIIHRDLKPGNILVDSNGEPKVIDFGVARSTDSDMAVTTLQTDIGQLIGTLQYMSPEQCDADPHDLDTRSDVYALGVVLYELLCGQTPYDVRKVAIHEATRLIREVAPVKPSSVERELRGDIETVTLKAIEKDRNRRYGSAAELGEDIHHYLCDEPIEARPPSLIYHLRKFAKRHRIAMVAVILVLIALIAATGLSTIFAVKAHRASKVAIAAQQTEAEQRVIAERERDRAVIAEASAEENFALAKRQAQIATAVNEFLNHDLLAAADPFQTANRDIRVRDVLDTASLAIENRFLEEPLIAAAIRSTLGQTYLNLGEFTRAEPHLVKTLELRRAELGENHPDTMLAASNLGELYRQSGHYSDAEVLLVTTHDRQSDILGANHPDALFTLNNLALLQELKGNYDEAEILFRKALESLQDADPNSQRLQLTVTGNLALLLQKLGQYEEAETLQLDVLQINQTTLGEDHPKTLVCMSNLANLYLAQGRYEEAEVVYNHSLELARIRLGEEHIWSIKTTSNLGVLYFRQGRFEESEKFYRSSLQTSRNVLGEDHPHTLLIMSNLAMMLQQWGRVDEAEPMMLEVLDRQRRVLGNEHPDVLTCINNLALLYSERGQYNDAERLMIELLDTSRRTLGEDHPDSLITENNLAVLYRNQERYKDAEPLYEHTLRVKQKTLGDEHPSTLLSMANLADLYLQQQRYSRAETLYATASNLHRKVLTEKHYGTGIVLTGFGITLTNLARFDQAEAILLEAYQILSGTLGDTHDRTIRAVQAIIYLYKTWDRPDQIDPWLIRLPKEETTDLTDE